MRKLRSLRRLIALTTLVGWALLQVAVTAYACPMESAQPVAMSSVAGEPMTTSNDVPPCAEHCATQHSVSSHAIPAAMPAFPAVTPIRVAPSTIVAETIHAARQHAERRTTRGDPVPLLVKLQVFRE
jgi:hypothetical protein